MKNLCRILFKYVTSFCMVLCCLFVSACGSTGNMGKIESEAPPVSRPSNGIPDSSDTSIDDGLFGDSSSGGSSGGGGSSGSGGGSSSGSGGGSSGGSTGGGSSSGGSTGGGSSGSGSSSGGGLFPTPEWGDIGGSGGSGSSSGGTVSTASIEDNVMGAICLYDLGSGYEDNYYDKFTSSKISFNEILNRQFNTLGTYIYNGLDKIYGNGGTKSISISGYGGNTYSAKLIDAIETNLQKSLTGVDSSISITNSAFVKYNGAISDKYKIDAKKVTKYYDDGGNEVTDPDKITNNEYSLSKEVYDVEYIVNDTNARKWIGSDQFTQKNIVNALKNIYYKVYFDAGFNNKNYSVAGDLNLNNTALRTYYSDASMLTQLHKDIDYTGFKFSGFTQDYMWHVLYYVAYTLVGNTNIADSLTAKENILEDQTIKFLTDENYDEYVDYFDRYKGYDEVLPNIIETVFELSINASNLNLSTYDYFSGENWETTLYPSVYAQQIIFYDDINNISDAIELPYEEDDELPEYDEDDDYIYEDNTEPGTARRLRKVIMIPKLNKNSEDKGLKTEFSGLIVGFQNDLKDIVINIYYNGYYENGTKEENIKMMFPEDKTGNYLISKNNVLTYKGINTGSLYCDFYGDTVSDNQTGKLFGSATTNVSGISNIERFVTDAFKTEKYRVSKSGEIFDIGVLGTHNRLFKLNTTKGSSSYNINLSKNYFDLTFNYAEYKNKESIELEVAPLVNLMYFIPF